MCVRDAFFSSALFCVRFIISSLPLHLYSFKKKEERNRRVEKTQPHRSAWQWRDICVIVGWIYYKKIFVCMCMRLLIAGLRLYTIRYSTQWLSVRGCIEIQIYILLASAVNDNNLQFSNFLIMSSINIHTIVFFFLLPMNSLYSLHIAAYFCVYFSDFSFN